MRFDRCYRCGLQYDLEEMLFIRYGSRLVPVCTWCESIVDDDCEFDEEREELVLHFSGG